MEHVLQSTAPDLLPPLMFTGVDSDVSADDLVTITQKELWHLKREGGYWKDQYRRVCEREAELKKELEQQEALIRDFKHRLFGKKSEAGRAQLESVQVVPAPKRPRGHQLGSPGHGRIKRPELPVIEEYLELSGECCRCHQCGLPYAPFPRDEESDIVEIQVSAYRRRVCRKRYRKVCSCPSTANNPAIIVAPAAPRVIPRSPYGVSVWVHILLGKFLYAQPLHRILCELDGLGLHLVPGTMTGGFKNILALFLPLQKALYDHQMRETWFHNDETRWGVYVYGEGDGQRGQRWYLWVTRSPEIIYYQMAPTRSAVVPLAHFSGLEATEVIVVCDRYSAYKKAARLNTAIILAFCWAHVRRDFLEVSCSLPSLQTWAFEWVTEIGTLYHLNHQRLSHWQKTLPLAQQNGLFHQEQARLEHQLVQMKESCGLFLQEDCAAAGSSPSKRNRRRPGELREAKRQVLTSLAQHWPGLTVFVDHPEVAMDNNPAERAIRNPVTGRKNYYGSGSIWSAQLAAVMFSLFQTIELSQLNVRHWLQEYLTACANQGGHAPADLTPFLPWHMSEEQRRKLAKPLPIDLNTS